MFAPRASSAQTAAENAHADALFNAGKQLRDAGQLQEACSMFAQSKQIVPAVGITLYLADCYERMGKTSSAWQQFREAEKMAHDHGDDKRAQVARTHAEALEPKLDQLTLSTSAASHDGWEVLLDGVKLPPDHLNHAMVVDPGDHAITVNAPNQPSRTLTAHLDDAHREVTLSIDPPASAGPAAAAVPVGAAAGLAAGAGAGAAPAGGAPLGVTSAADTAPGASPAPVVPAGSEAPAAAAAGSSTRFWAGMALVGAGVVGGGLGTAYLIKRNKSMNNGTLCDPPYDDTPDKTAAIVAYSVGGAALTAALILYLTAPSPTKEVGLLVAPTALPGGAGATLRTTF
jgi:hypothetical protein